MPKAILVPLIEKNNGMLSTPEYLIAITKQHFYVSEQVARIRLENLGLVTSSVRTSRDVKRYETGMESVRGTWSQDRW
jgi:Zn-dependent peptidase ImmA (M78 family)